MNRLAAVFLSLLFALAALAAPASAQFDSVITDSVQRRHVSIAPTEVTPADMYVAIQNDWPFVPPQTIGTITAPRRAKFVGVARVDHAYWVQNRYTQIVTSYQEYTANLIRAVPIDDPTSGDSGTQVCTQFCGQMVHPGYGTYALAPFAGVYQEPTTAPFPVQCQGVDPLSDFHFFRAPNIAVPIELWLGAGRNEIRVHSMGGMGSWDDHPTQSVTHQYAYANCINTIGLEGWILSR